jgi:hypothetical protein
VSTEQEIQLSDDLRQLVANHNFAGDPDALVRRGRQAKRRSVATRGAAGIGVLAVAAAGTVVATHSGGASTPPVQDAAYVTRHVSAALDGDDNYVYRITDQAEGTVQYDDQVTDNEYWIYGSGNTRTVAWDSSPVVEHYVHLLDTTVDYQNKTYSTDDQKLPGYVSGALPKETTIVERIKESISTGEDKIVGTGEYQGHQVIKLSYTSKDVALEMWVDATTYQPVHSITDVDGLHETVDLAFLPRTPDLENTINNPQVPTGFAKVADALPANSPGHGG